MDTWKNSFCLFVSLVGDGHVVLRQALFPVSAGEHVQTHDHVAGRCGPGVSSVLGALRGWVTETQPSSARQINWPFTLWVVVLHVSPQFMERRSRPSSSSPWRRSRPTKGRTLWPTRLGCSSPCSTRWLAGTSETFETRRQVCLQAACNGKTSQMFFRCSSAFIWFCWKLFVSSALMFVLVYFCGNWIFISWTKCFFYRNYTAVTKCK